MTGLRENPKPAAWTRRLERWGSMAFCAAIIASPLGFKIPAGPAAVSPCDVLMAAAGVFFLPAFLLGLPGSLRPVRPSLPLLGVAMVSALAGGNAVDGAREVAQLALYAACGVWVCSRVVMRPGGASRVRASAGLGFAVGITGLLIQAGWPGSRAASGFYGGPATAFVPWILAGACLALTSRIWRGSAVVLVGAAAVSGICFLNSSEKPGAPEPVPQLRSEIGQRWLEAYAAVSVVSRFPLLGLGPGNYQQHIGEYYGTMPKDNTMAAGSQVGYAVVVASMGLLGLAGLLYWFAQLAVWMIEARPPAYVLAAPLLLLSAAGLFTPLFVSQMLAPLALVHGVAWARRTGHA
ncbi:MAG: hypothetical protein NTZ09_04935 [Candidatus Hydrogenedentes bacterium]|nr:hypothetical protein [Candidatus Hydrogenedentota bacterium]